MLVLMMTDMSLGFVVEVDHENAFQRGENIKYRSVPDDIAQKPENLYVRGILTEKAVSDIDAAPSEKKNVTPDVQVLFDAAPGLVKQLRQNKDYRDKILWDSLSQSLFHTLWRND